MVKELAGAKFKFPETQEGMVALSVILVLGDERLQFPRASCLARLALLATLVLRKDPASMNNKAEEELRMTAGGRLSSMPAAQSFKK